MGLLDRALGALGWERKGFVEYPTISGGFDVLKSVLGGSGMSQSRMLESYGKSLYVFACVSKIAQKTASIDLELFRIVNKAGDTKQVFVHEALDLIYRPNPFQTKGEFFERWMINKKLTGEAFILKVRDGGGRVVELWNLRPDLMRVLRDERAFVKGYEFTTSRGVTLFKPEDIIHDAYPSPLDDWGGMSPLRSAEARVDTEEFASRYQRNFFLNNARPDFILTSERKIGPDQKEEMKRSFEKRHQGPDKGGKGAFLEGGLSYQQVSISQREMDYIESMKYTRDDILVAFQVPKPIVAITDDVNLANAKTAMEIFLAETIKPEIVRITEKLNEHLVYPQWGEIYYLDFVDPVPSNDREMAELQEIKIRSGVMLINEAREEWGMEPVVGGWSLRQPVSQVVVGGLPQNGPKKAKADTRQKVFAGRGNAVKILEIKEEVKRTMYKALKAEAEAASEPMQRPLVPAEIRRDYAEVTNKSIDLKGGSLKDALLEFAADQEMRLLAATGIDSGKAKAVEKGVLDDLKAWAKEEAKLAASFVLPFVRSFAEEAGEDALQVIAPAETFSPSATLEKLIKQRAKEFGKGTTATTVEAVSGTLAEGIAEGEGIAALRGRVRAVFEEFPAWRAELIARTEATAANNAGFQDAYRQSGVANAKEWIATMDARTRDEHAALDGQIVPLDKTFGNGLPYPSEPNCRCVLGPAFLEVA
jgi:HK97 family phage portal protein